MSTNTSGTRRALHVVGVVALIALVVPFLLFAVPGAVGADRSYVVLSGSMEPAISAGDAVLVDSVDPRTIAVGDVITFREADEGVPTTHRVVGVIDRTEAGPTLAFRTQGDANEDADVGAVRPDQVVGKVVLVLPYVGHVVGFVDSEVGFLALVLGPVLLFVLNEVWTWRSHRSAGDDPEPAPEPAAVDRPEEAGVSLTATDLTLSIGVLAVLAAFSGWMALQTIAVEAVVTFAAATTALVLAVALRLLLPPAPTTAPEVGAADGGRRVVGSLATLTAAARERGRPVVTDGEGSYFVDGGVLYLHREGLAPAPTAAPADTPRPAVRRVPRPAVRRIAADGGDTEAER